MKILMYAPIFPPMIGGPSTQCHQLCRSLKKHGQDVVVITVGEKFQKEDKDGYFVYRYPWKFTNTPLDKIIRWVIFPLYFWKILSKEKPDIVHAHSVSALSFIVGFICSLRGTPNLIKFAGDWVWETLSTGGVKAKDFDELYQKSLVARCMWTVEKWGLSLYDHIWVPSEFRAENIERVLGHRDNTTVIYNALDLPEGGFHDMKTGDQFVIISASRFIPHKRIPELIDVLAPILGATSRLVFFGSNDNLSELNKIKQAIKKNQLESRVFLSTDKITEKDYDYFRQASIYISNSLEEGFPNVFVEAVHFGLPIISTDVGGCSEIVSDGETGFLYDINDYSKLTNRVKILMEDYTLRNKMAKKAYELSHKYELDHVVEEFINLYKSIINQRQTAL